MIRLGESARTSLETQAELLYQRFDVPTRIRGSLKSHPTGWLVGSLASGLAASLVFGGRAPARTAPEKTRRSLPLTLLGLSLTAVRPFAKVWLTDQAKHYFAGQRPKPVVNHPH